jgi:sugar-specific transcriptional regulator TrmB
MNTLFTQQLTKLGLSDKEALTFISLLSAGTLSVQEIASLTNLNRSTAYVVLESLCKKGFVVETTSEDRLYYEAVSPETIQVQARDRAEKSLKLELKAQALLPQLEGIRKNKEHYPKTRFFEGKEGIKTVQRDILELPKGSKIVAIASTQDFVDECIDKGLVLRSIQGAFKKDISNFLISATHRYIPAQKFAYTSDLYICAEKVAFISTVEEFGVILESKDFAEVMKEAFELAWKEAERLDAVLRKTTSKAAR